MIREQAYTINNEQEAIRELEIMRRCFKSFSVQFQALSMAIKALEQITKIADILDGTIDHFDYDDAMDTLYEIKAVIK